VKASPVAQHRSLCYSDPMPLHLIKLAVGAESFADIAEWQAKRLKDAKARGKTPELLHVTRQKPKRADELLAGGSIYWVVKGFVTARQRLLDLRDVTRDGVPHCALVLDPRLIPVALRPHRAFQGWRYLDAKSAPPDRKGRGAEAQLPEELKRELAALGLL